MKIGLQIPDFTTPRGPERLGAELATVARTADDAGFEYIAVMDHFFQIPAVGPAEQGDARGVHDAGLPGRLHVAGRAAHGDHGHGVPGSRRPGEDRHHA